MRTLDPRLLRKARGARWALAADVALGLLATVALLAQATLFAYAVSQAFAGRGLGSVATALGLLAALAVARGLLAGAFEATGRRAAVGVMSQLRLRARGAAPARRARRPPTAPSRARSRRPPCRASTRSRPTSPATCPSSSWPCSCLSRCSSGPSPSTRTSALIMALTLPLIPLFMWLIGRYTEGRTRARWRALARLSNHFLDVMRGLTTLRAFNRGEVQAERIAAVGEEYRRTTMQTLRVAFVSGAVLDLAATLATALVAVTLGLRLVDGAVTLRAALTVLLLTPELYVPLRALAQQFHASADGLAAAERILDLIDVPRGRRRPAPRRRPTWQSVAPRRRQPGQPGPPRAGARRRRARDPPRRGRRPGRPQRLGQDDARRAAAGAAPPRRRQRDRRRPRPRRARPRRLAPPGVVGAAAARPCSTARWRTTSPSEPTGSPRPGSSARRASPAPTSSCASCRAATTPTIGEGGRSLSAGETRRIALARALVRDAPLLILDEPTADLDAESADVVAAAIGEAREGRAVLVIEHRPALARLADRVVRLTDGKAIVEKGAVAGVKTLLELLRCRPAAPRAGRRRRSPSGRWPCSRASGCMAFAGYLISRAAERPPVLSLGVVIVAVRFFGLARPLARYFERLTSHDLAFRLLARMRVAFFARLEPLVPAARRGLPQGRSAGPHGRRRRRPAEPVPARAHAAARRAARRRRLGRGLRGLPAGRRARPGGRPAGRRRRRAHRGGDRRAALRRAPGGRPRRAHGRAGRAPARRPRARRARRRPGGAGARRGARLRARRAWPAARLWRRAWSRGSGSPSSA